MPAKTNKLLCLIWTITFLTPSMIKAELIAPPNISETQQQAFLSWKKHYQSEDDVPSNSALNKPTYINELVLSQSPYLKQHSNNPINWKPWSNSLLAKAKVENKLIFLSIGYSSCHWCHVMNEESFSSVELAKIINQNFYAIKVDREELPHIDDYYLSALKALKQSGGWPITAIVNGDGLPVFIDSYLGKKELVKALNKINLLWQSQPSFLLSIAKSITSIADKSPFMPASNLGNLVNSRTNKLVARKLLNKINSDLLSMLDIRDGGFKGKAKFPSEPLLLYGLDQLLIEPNSKLENLIELQLDHMISSELYDHVSGGFHRYTSNSNWTNPHFEKTLYNQAQLLLVYIKAYQYFGKKSYHEVTLHTLRFLLTQFYAKGQGFISAIDADFEGSEGGYYLWDQKQIDDLAFSKEILTTYKVNGSNKVGVIFNRASSEKQATLINAARNKLSLYRSNRGSPNYDDKIITGWNGLTLKALTSASVVLNKPEYLEIAKLIATYLWDTRFDKANGQLQRNRYQATDKLFYLSDYAYLADAFISLYDVTEDDIWITRAKRLERQIVEKFQDDQGQIFNHSQKTSVFSSKNSSDSELLSPFSIVLSVKNKLDKRISNDRWARLSKVDQKNLIDRVSSRPVDHLSDAKTLSDIFFGTNENVRYFAQSNGRAKFNCLTFENGSCQNMEVNLRLSNNWHINSNSPLQKHLVATEIETSRNIVITYPNSKKIKLGFQEEPLSVFSGHIKITLKKINSDSTREYLNVPIQACNDHLCLLPEQLRFLM